MAETRAGLMKRDLPVVRLTALPGDGIGPEVTEAALFVLQKAAEDTFVLDRTDALVGGAAIDAMGAPLPPDTEAACASADAVFLGAVGGPKWDTLPPAIRPERGLLRLRTLLGGFANLRPVAVPEALAGFSPVRPERVTGTDMLIVRELLGGIYFGEPRGIHPEPTGVRVGFNTMRYTEAEIERIAHVAFRWAEQRRGHVTSVDKANVLDVSRLWREVVTDVQRRHYPHITLEHLYVDNAAMQIVLRPTGFDVLLTSNLFGDILSDLAATLPGSLGVLPSASVGGRVPLFEPVHGSAPDLAGQNVANPAGAILSAAMLADTLGYTEVGRSIRVALDAAWADGIRTRDLGGTASTDALMLALVDRLPDPVS